MKQQAIPRVSSRKAAALLAAATLSAVPAVGVAEIIWSGDYKNGDFRQWHKHNDRDLVGFFMIPEYGRPIQYGGQESGHVGNGDLLSLVAATERTVDGIRYPKGPTRGSSEYAARFTVKNSENGSEPRDCDGGTVNVCKRRRTELTVQSTLPEIYNALGYRSERWISVSHFMPADWDDSGSGWGVLVFQIKPKNDGGGVGPCIDIEAAKGHWQIRHAWTDIQNYSDLIPWRQSPRYSPTYPASGAESGDLLADFPNVGESRAALADLNKGGWTDWVFHVVFDARGSQDGGNGLLELWKRAGDGPWVKVLHIEPKKVTVANQTYDRGICYNSPGGFGIKAGMYMDKTQVWNLNDNRVLYNANIKVGSADTPFSAMSPDGSSPGNERGVIGTEAPPLPPTVLE
jgi:hypothetical protein